MEKLISNIKVVHVHDGIEAVFDVNYDILGQAYKEMQAFNKVVEKGKESLIKRNIRKFSSWLTALALEVDNKNYNEVPSIKKFTKNLDDMSLSILEMEQEEGKEKALETSHKAIIEIERIINSYSAHPTSIEEHGLTEEDFKRQRAKITSKPNKRGFALDVRPEGKGVAFLKANKCLEALSIIRKKIRGHIDQTVNLKESRLTIDALNEEVDAIHTLRGIKETITIGEFFTRFSAIKASYYEHLEVMNEPGKKVLHKYQGFNSLQNKINGVLTDRYIKLKAKMAKSISELYRVKGDFGRSAQDVARVFWDTRIIDLLKSPKLATMKAMEMPGSTAIEWSDFLTLRTIFEIGDEHRKSAEDLVIKKILNEIHKFYRKEYPKKNGRWARIGSKQDGMLINIPELEGVWEEQVPKKKMLHNQRIHHQENTPHIFKIRLKINDKGTSERPATNDEVSLTVPTVVKKYKFIAQLKKKKR